MGQLAGKRKLSSYSLHPLPSPPPAPKARRAGLYWLSICYMLPAAPPWLASVSPLSAQRGGGKPLGSLEEGPHTLRNLITCPNPKAGEIPIKSKAGGRSAPFSPVGADYRPVADEGQQLSATHRAPFGDPLFQHLQP